MQEPETDDVMFYAKINLQDLWKLTCISEECWQLGTVSVYTSRWILGNT